MNPNEYKYTGITYTHTGPDGKFTITIPSQTPKVDPVADARAWELTHALLHRVMYELGK